MALDLSFGGTRFPRAAEVRHLLYSSGAKGVSPRFRFLHRLDSYYRCQEYDELKFTWEGFSADQLESVTSQAALPFGFTRPAEEVALRFRRPSLSLRLTPLIVNRFTDLLFSAERKPKIRVEDDPNSEDFLKAVVEEGKLFRTMIEARNYGGAMGSALILAHLREGRFVFKAHSPKTIQEVSWKDADLKIPEGVLIQYVYYEAQEILDTKTGTPTGQVKQVPFLFRRIIDEEMDITFKKTEIRGGEIPNPEVDEAKTYRHNLGRFPGVWIQNLPSSEDLDGLCDTEGLHENMEALDRQTSQSNAGLLKNQDPTLVISRDKKNVQFNVPLKKGSENAIDVGSGGSANYLEIGAQGITAAREFVRENRTWILDNASAVVPDPEKISGAAQSAKAIEFIYAAMLAKADRLRDQYGEAIQELMLIVLLLAREFSKPANYTGNVQPKFYLTDRIEEDPDTKEVLKIRRHPGSGERITLKWGAYFKKTPNDIQMESATIAAMKQAQLLDAETAVRMICELLEIDDVDGVMERLAAEREANSMIMGDQEGDGFYPDAQATDAPVGGVDGDFPPEDGGEDPALQAPPQEGPPGFGAAPVPPQPPPRVNGGENSSSPPPEYPPELQAIYDKHAGEAEQAPDEKGVDLAAILARQGGREYNGAQIGSAMEIVTAVATGDLPRDSGINFLVIMLGLEKPAAEAIMDEVGRTFFAEKEEPEYGGGGFH